MRTQTDSQLLTWLWGLQLYLASQCIIMNERTETTVPSAFQMTHGRRKTQKKREMATPMGFEPTHPKIRAKLYRG